MTLSRSDLQRIAVHGLAEHLCAAYSRSMSPDEVEEWVAPLDQYEPDAISAAGTRLVASETRMPTLNAVIDAVQAEARARMNAPARRRPIPTAADPAQRRRAALGMRLLQEHRERPGEFDETAFMADIRAAGVAIPDDDPRAAIFRCGECFDTEFVYLDHAGQGTVRPCRRCRPEAYHRWSDGHHEPNHSCPECGHHARRRSA